jgi:ABC-type sugar transport system ATPase subunit
MRRSKLATIIRERRRRLSKLHKRFGATHALKPVNLNFEAEEVHMIVGKNGAGNGNSRKRF